MQAAEAAVYFSRSNGRWSQTNTWSTTGYAGPAAASTPGSAPGDVVMISGYKINIDATPANAILSLTISQNNNTGNDTEFDIKGGTTVLTVNGLSMLDKALANRLERKANEINSILIRNKQDWEETSYQILARNFGFKLNSEVFLRLAEVLPLKIIKKHQGNLFQIEALCFGQAGFLNDSVDDYSRKLETEYTYLANKYGLQSLTMSKHQWKYLRTRPSNFPSIRLHQFASIINSTRSFFLDFVLNARKENIIKLLHILPSKYWQTHYDFDKKSKVLLKGLGNSSIENVIINTTVSLLAAYSFSTGLQEYFERAVEILGELKSEKNTITEKWENLGLKIKSSFDSQAVIEQYNEYCSKKRCLECSIGSTILKRDIIRSF